MLSFLVWEIKVPGSCLSLPCVAGRIDSQKRTPGFWPAVQKKSRLTEDGTRGVMGSDLQRWGGRTTGK